LINRDRRWHNQLAGKAIADEAQAYLLVLPDIETRHPNTPANTNRCGETRGRESNARSIVSQSVHRIVEEIDDAKLSVVTLASEIFGPSGFDPSRDGSTIHRCLSSGAR